MKQTLHLIFLGAPGAGKGTQARLLMDKIKITQISTGDILRAEIKGQTSLGTKAKEYIDKGNLVPDELIIDMIKSKMQSKDFPENWIMDGFPRTLPQAIAFDNLLKELSLSVSMVIDFVVPVDWLVNRLTSRRICRNCGTSYNVLTKPAKKEGICDLCNGELYQRSDDTITAVKERMNVYENQTAPLIEYYQKQGLYKSLEGTKGIDEIQENLIALLES